MSLDKIEAFFFGLIKSGVMILAMSFVGLLVGAVTGAIASVAGFGVAGPVTIALSIWALFVLLGLAAGFAELYEKVSEA